jgi:hypothetical protein
VVLEYVPLHNGRAGVQKAMKKASEKSWGVFVARRKRLALARERKEGTTGGPMVVAIFRTLIHQVMMVFAAYN